jgi:hypothetical protein
MDLITASARTDAVRIAFLSDCAHTIISAMAFALRIHQCPGFNLPKRFVIVRNPDFRAPVVREFDILSTSNPKLVARKRDNLDRLERRLGQFSQLLNHSGARSESRVNFSNTLLRMADSTNTQTLIPNMSRAGWRWSQQSSPATF